MKKIIYFLAGFTLAISTTALAAGPFTDLGGFSDWYKSSVLTLQEKGIVKGYEDGSFGPNKYITRAEMAVMLDRHGAYTLNKELPDALYNTLRQIYILDKNKEYDSYNRPMVIMSEMGYRKLSERPSGELIKAEDEILPNGYTAYAQPFGPYILTYLNYKGVRAVCVSDVFDECHKDVEEWYGPF